MTRSIPIATGALLVSLTTVPGLAQSTSQDDAPQQAGGAGLSQLGGFLGLDLRFNDIGDEFAAFVGGEAALVLRPRLYVGIRGGGLATDNHRIPASGSSETEIMGMGYGGLLLGYTVPIASGVNVSLDALIGAGGVGVRDATSAEEWDPVFLFEPGLAIDVTLLSIKGVATRIGIGAGYRFVGDVETPGLREQDLRGVTGLVRLRVGRF